MQLILITARDLRGFLATLQLVKDLAFCFSSSIAVLKGNWKSDREFEAGAISLCILGTFAAFALCVYMIAFAFECADCMLPVFWSTFFFLLFLVTMWISYRIRL